MEVRFYFMLNSLHYAVAMAGDSRAPCHRSAHTWVPGPLQNPPSTQVTSSGTRPSAASCQIPGSSGHLNLTLIFAGLAIYSDCFKQLRKPVQLHRSLFLIYYNCSNGRPPLRWPLTQITHRNLLSMPGTALGIIKKLNCFSAVFHYSSTD